MHPEIQSLIDHFDLKPLPVEGTLYIQSYYSRATTASGDPAGTAIVGLYCEEPRSVSCFHRVAHDELWHFYRGDAMHLILLHDDGSSEEIVMGGDLAAGQRVQYLVPAGTLQAGELLPGGRYALYGCSVAPGFTPASFSALPLDAMLARWPDRAADIERLCAHGDLVMPPDTR